MVGFSWKWVNFIFNVTIMKKLLLGVLFFVPFVLRAQIITTVAGLGTIGYTGDGGCAIAAHTGPGGGDIVFDHLGNYYYEVGDNVRKISTTGIITTIAGVTGSSGYYGDGGPATAALFNELWGIDIDSHNNIYVGDVDNNRVRKIDASTGIITTFAGTGSPGFSGDGGPATAAKLNNPYAVCFDRFDNFYIADRSNHRIRKVDATTGIISTIGGGAGIGGIDSGDGGLATAAEIGTMNGITTDTSGNIYFSCSSSVRKIDVTTGIITLYAGDYIGGSGGDGGSATAARLSGPNQIVFDGDNNLFISDEGNNNVRKVTTAGIISSAVGTGVAGFYGDGGPATSAELYSTRGVAFDHFENLFIFDNGNLRIRKVTYNPATGPFITTSISPNDTLCAGTTALFSAVVSAATGTPTYHWYVNGHTVGTSTASYSYIPANGDSVRCFLNTVSTCFGAASSNSNTIDMVVDPLLIPSISIAGLSSASVGATVTVTATVSGAGGSYIIHWLNHGIEFTTSSVPSVTYTKGAGIDTITAKILSTAVGCYDSTTSSAHIVSAASTGVGFNAVQEMVVYPNPTNDLLQVDNIAMPTNYQVHTIVGVTVLEGTLQQGSNSISLKALPVGIYVLELVDEHGGRVVRTVVKAGP